MMSDPVIPRGALVRSRRLLGPLVGPSLSDGGIGGIGGIGGDGFGSLHRAFAGGVRLVVEERTPTAPPSFIDPSDGPVVASFDAKAEIEQDWNSVRNTVRGNLMSAVEGIPSRNLPGRIREFKNAEATLGWANRESDFATLYVDVTNRVCLITYYVADNQLRFVADIKQDRDAKIVVDFDIALTMGFATGGDPSTAAAQQVLGSVWLTTLEIRLTDPRATVRRGPLAWLYDFFSTGSFSRNVELGLAGSASLMSAHRLFTNSMRDALQQAQDAGHSIDNVVPSHGTNADIELRLVQPLREMG